MNSSSKLPEYNHSVFLWTVTVFLKDKFIISKFEIASNGAPVITCSSILLYEFNILLYSLFVFLYPFASTEIILPF